MPSKKRSAGEPLRIFSWGYKGWGNASQEFVELADSVEKARGFAPPLFVDVRIRREARAVGFRSKAFEELLGRDRYLWIHGLGNGAILTGESGVIRIAAPSSVGDLLDAALQAAKKNRRVIFFCSCLDPGTIDEPQCHRTEVGTLLLREAAQRGIGVALQEWPGGEPRILNHPRTAQIGSQLESARKTLTVEDSADLAALGSLAYGSIVVFGREVNGLAVPIRRLRYGTNGWGLETLDNLKWTPAGGARAYLKEMVAKARRDGFAKRTTVPHNGS